MEFAYGNRTASMLIRPGSIHPSGWRYRILGLCLGSFLMVLLSGFYGIASIVTAFEGSGFPEPVDILNASLWGAGYAVFLVPYGLVAGALSAEAALGFAKLFVTRSRHWSEQTRPILAFSAASIGLVLSLLLSFVFGFQLPIFYVVVFVFVLVVFYLLDPWLNRKF